MNRAKQVAVMCALAVVAVVPRLSQAAPKVERGDASVRVDLGNGVRLDFAVHNGHLLGLRGATAQGVALKSDQTLVRPYLIEEWKDNPVSFDGLRLADISTEGNKVVLSGQLVARADADANKRFFVLGENGKPHLDFYRFPHVQLPSTIARVDAQRNTVAELSGGNAAASAGTFRWVLEPVTHNVGGFTWNGWQHHYEFKLSDGRKLNAVRELSTWETGGNAVGNTLVAFRYRGLGGLAPKLEPLDEGSDAAKGVKNAFTTTEIMPGAVGKAPVISPAVPGPQGIAGREEAMKYRHGAWIAHMQRGAGANWIDFQFRDTIGLASFYNTMQAIRSVSEVWPGDTEVSYTDNLYFPLSAEIKTPSKTFIALVPPNEKKELATHEWRTRYQEMDQHVRDILCRDLGFVQHEPLPTLGINWDSGWEFRLNQAVGSVEKWREAGIKRVITHHPGWFNGRGLRQKETPHPIPQKMLIDPKKPDEPAKMTGDTGGDCSIHDYVPQSPKVADLWKAFGRKLNENDMEYWVWITGMIYGTGPVVEKFGEGRFTRNSPDVTFSSGYPGQHGRAGHRGISMRDREMREWWVGRMNDASQDLGVSGFWADSFQNMFMSQMNYQHEDWAPHVREWWEWIASETRNGVGWMAESHSFPGLSCSIEVGGQQEGYAGDEWVMMYSTRWYRGTPVPHKGTEKADQIFFRTMANKGPIAPGGADPSQIPSLKRLSDEYMAALPAMNRPYQLADGSVLWLPFGSDDEAVLFAFGDVALPKGVTAAGIVEQKDAGVAKAHHTYRLKGNDLPAAFGVTRGDQPDPRLARTYQKPKVFIKDWAK